MDEDDSQDELINPSRSHSKGKRAAVWDISDDSEDELEEESAEGESDSSGDDDDDDDHSHGDEEDEDEEEEDVKPEDGTVGGTSEDFVNMSSDEDAEKCPICLNSFTSQPVATPENCEHYFCFDCILEWAKNSNSCPVDRITFDNVYLRKCYGGKLKKIITVQKPIKERQEETVDLDLEQTNCEVCGGSDREDRLLLCDSCDAGYHMECLTPPIDSVPVEEWFCPECDANNRQSRNPDAELRDLHSLPSTARPATSQSQTRAAGRTRAIARTQQSERVRASVNRNRITQARSSQLAPTYLIQSTWLDETINAVVAGLNTAVYVRDFTPRAPSGRKRKAGKRRKVRSKKTSSTHGVKGKTVGTKVKRRKRRRRTKSQKKVLKRVPTPRSRIANNLGIAKDKKSSSLPTMYRPSENTLSGMRADIGAASLSIYGDPFDLDPFVEREEVEQQVHVSSLLEAKRRGISHSALRSHQPVARPLTTSLSRRHLDVRQTETVVEAAPVPDLLGSILSGQSMLLMDSSDVVINRDGTLKSAKPVVPSTLVPGSRKSRSSGEDSNSISPGLSPNLPESSSVLSHNEDLRISSSSMNRTFSQSSSRLSSCTPFSASHPRPTPNIDVPSRSPLTTYPHQPIASSIQQETNEALLLPEVGTKSKTVSSSHVPSKKAPLKPAWVDVAVLPRIPKIKRENTVLTAESSSQDGNISRNRDNHSRIGGTSADCGGSHIGMPKSSINSLSGDKGRKQSVDQPKSQTGGPSQRDRANSSSSTSSSFSNSFSSSTSSHASQPRHSASSSSSTAVSFRINSSGNSWQSRRLNVMSSFAGAGPQHDRLKAKQEEVKNRQLHRDKQMLLASCATASKEQDMYDPFNPTASDSSNSDSELDCTNKDDKSHQTTVEERTCNSKDKKAVVLNSQNVAQIKKETQEVEVSQEESSKALKARPSEVRGSQDKIKIKKESTLERTFEKQPVVFDVKVKKEQKWEEPEEASITSNIHVNTEKPNTSLFADHRLDQTTQDNIKVEKIEQCVETSNKSILNYELDSQSGSSVMHKKKLKEETQALSPQRSPVQNSKMSNSSKKHYSSSSETDGGRRAGHLPTTRGDKPREKDMDRRSKRSSSRERRRVRSSDSSQPNSPDRTRQKRRSQSSSKDKLRRSRSSSSSRERSRRKKYRQRSEERDDGKERRTKEKRRDRRRSKSQSKSRSRSRSNSRSRARKRGSSRSKSRSRSRERKRCPSRTANSSSKPHLESQSKDKRRRRSRSNSRERRKEVGSSNISLKTPSSSVSFSKDAKASQGKRKEKGITPISSHREEKLSKVRKLEPNSSASRAGVKLEGDCETTNKVPIVEMTKGKTTLIGIRNEQRIVDICKDITKEQQQSVNICKDIKKEQPIVEICKDIKEQPIVNICKDIKKEQTIVSICKDMKKEQSTVKICKDIMKEQPIVNICKDVKKEQRTVDICKDTRKEQPIVDMFEESPSSLSLKKKHLNPNFTARGSTEQETCLPIKSESSHLNLSKCKPDTKDGLQSSLNSPVCPLTVSDPVPVSAGTIKRQEDVEMTFELKQETQQASTLNEDLMVDMALNNVENVKSEQTKMVAPAIKQEKEVMEEEKNHDRLPSASAGVKSKTQVKRVTWNIQEPEGPQPEKSASKVALYKKKLKQEGIRRPSAIQTSTRDPPGTSVDPNKKRSHGPHSATSTSDSLQSEEISGAALGEHGEQGDLSRKDKYLKKLHMQERAVEEVKLAIKPYYQGRDINKEEYKDILRKAVQKVCHSKSGEINPVKVGNLVKAYVDKYKHARKQKKGEDSEKAADVPCDAMVISDSP